MHSAGKAITAKRKIIVEKRGAEAKCKTGTCILIKNKEKEKKRGKGNFPAVF
jgi:hypothetical protein